MPIKGKILATPSEYRVDTMIPGERAYICIDFIVITRKAVFIEIFTPVLPEEEYEDDLPNFIPIKRIGPGYTEDDFEIEGLDASDFDLMIDPHPMYVDLMRNKDCYIVFTNPEFVTEDPENIILRLDAELQQAIKDQDFKLAAKLRDKLQEIRKEKKENN